MTTELGVNQDISLWTQWAHEWVNVAASSQSEACF